MQFLNDEERKKEFQRQKDRLKMMSIESERKAVSADSMIQNLLQDAGTFKKVQPDICDMPGWLIADKPTSCQQYETIWNAYKGSGPYVDTPRLFQLLLTSNLHPDVLGFIWSIANKTNPGQLTKQELFIVLALVGLAQTGCIYKDVSSLKMVQQPPIPVFTIPTTATNSEALRPNETVANNFTIKKEVDELESSQSAIKKPLVGDDFQTFQTAFQTSSLKTDESQELSRTTMDDLLKTQTLRADDFQLDDFQDFQAAPISILSETFHEDDFTDFQSAMPAIPSPSQIKVSPESERRLKSFTQQESLTHLPESKISTQNTVSSLPSIAVFDAIPPRKHKSLSSPVELFPKCCPKSQFVLKETRIPSVEPETSKHTETQGISSKNDLFSVDDDKYRALRELNEPKNEDFSDFLSGTAEEKEAQAWCVWNSSIGPHSVINEAEILPEKLKSEDDDDDFGDFETPTLRDSPLPSLDLVMDNFPDVDGKSDLVSNLDPLVNFSIKEEVSLDNNIPQRCLKCCKNLLLEALDIFNKVSSKDVLEEVFSTSRAKDYIKYLYIVYGIAQRVSKHSLSYVVTIKEIDELWLRLGTLAKEHNIQIENEDCRQPVSSGDPCRVCQFLTDSNDIQQNGACFHVTCANLWINCIDTCLPCF